MTSESPSPIPTNSNVPILKPTTADDTNHSLFFLLLTFALTIIFVLIVWYFIRRRKKLKTLVGAILATGEIEKEVEIKDEDLIFTPHTTTVNKKNSENEEKDTILMDSQLGDSSDLGIQNNRRRTDDDLFESIIFSKSDDEDYEDNDNDDEEEGEEGEELEEKEEML
ncbi:60S ribosomal protein L18A [Anaeramoeba flamelloides]|uniref:60S ribosomal protein L18A n=1 Tax=Anaeramoeba flamelloides TaxID=1746091 RepID=A0AAV8AB82_9EUKA|nr:60S ribosomal protein L18A [Anaeramoeba flamelloides]